jgi:glycerophosphoryl diester phosphodiesterase
MPSGFLQAARLALGRGLRPLLTCEIVWRVLWLLVLGPLSVAVLNALVQQSGRPAVTNLGLLSFGLSPLGLVILVLGATASLTLTALELAGLLLVLLPLFRGRQVTARQALRATGARLPALLGIALWQVLLGLLAALPFAVAAGLVWWLLLSGSDINFYLARRPPKFLLAAGIGAVLAVGLAVVLAVLYVRWLFAVPTCLFEGKTGRGALRASAGLVRGHFKRLLAWLVGWQVLRVACSAAALLGLGRLNQALLAADTEAGAPLVRTVLCLAIDGAVLLVLSMVERIGFAVLVAVLFEDLHRRGGGTLAEGLPSEGLPPQPLPRALRLAAWAGLVVLGGSVLGQSVLLAGQFAARKPVGVTAHRAGAFKGPENTLAALRLAIADGADFAEIDVQETADGVVVVLHDKDLRRLTGDPRSIWEVSYQELQSLDAGSWFGPAFRGERIATLEEFLEAAQGRIQLNIELKYNGHDQRLAERVVDLLRKHDFLNQAVITSLEYRGLQEVRELEPRLRTGYIVSASLGDLTRLDVDFLSVRDALVTPALRRRTYARGWEIHAWTVNDRKRMEAMLDRDVDNLITDDVPLAREVLRQRQDLPDVELILQRLHAWMRS